jgi:two-component system phosphate regulon sensor histidine kinase PhoR
MRVARLADGAEHGTIVVFHDVTDLRRLETIRTDFVANVSHELRTPVTAISTATETLIGGALGDPAEAAEFVDVIDRHSKRLRQLVDDLLDLAKLEAKSFRLVLTDLEVRPILAHAISLTGEHGRRRKMTLTLAPGDALRARIDRRGLEQVVMNLLDNAIKYAGEGAHVTVSARAEGDRVEIAVADDGVGISPAHLGRVFERFYRVDAGRSRELGGTGLGLAIVKHLVELMGGTVDVESEPGKGARFTLRLMASGAPSRPEA